MDEWLARMRSWWVDGVDQGWPHGMSHAPRWPSGIPGQCSTLGDGATRLDEHARPLAAIRAHLRVYAGMELVRRGVLTRSQPPVGVLMLVSVRNLNMQKDRKSKYSVAVLWRSIPVSLVAAVVIGGVIVGLAYFLVASAEPSPIVWVE